MNRSAGGFEIVGFYTSGLVDRAADDGADPETLIQREHMRCKITIAYT